jgi:nitrogen fixation protein NifU and related proteins
VSPLSDPRSALEVLYRETVLEHYRRPRNRQPLEHPDASALVHNPVCGDQVRVELRMAGAAIGEVAAVARGCSIAVASGSLMTEIARGAAPAAVRAQHASLARLVHGQDPGEVLDPRLQPFARVAELPSRRRCALLAWEALEQALGEAQPIE